MEPPFQKWYAIVDGGCWCLGQHISREDAEKDAITTFNVHHSKADFLGITREEMERLLRSGDATLASLGLLNPGLA